MWAAIFTGSWCLASVIFWPVLALLLLVILGVHNMIHNVFDKLLLIPKLPSSKPLVRADSLAYQLLHLLALMRLELPSEGLVDIIGLSQKVFNVQDNVLEERPKVWNTICSKLETLQSQLRRLKCHRDCLACANRNRVLDIRH